MISFIFKCALRCSLYTTVAIFKGGKGMLIYNATYAADAAYLASHFVIGYETSFDSALVSSY